MPSTAPAPAPARAVFDALLELAQARTLALVETGALGRDDGWLLLRALTDLECDGVELFGVGGAVDDAFYARVADYLVARAGHLARTAGVLAPESAEAIAAVATQEGSRVAELLTLPGAAPGGRALHLAVLELIDHRGGNA